MGLVGKSLKKLKHKISRGDSTYHPNSESASVADSVSQPGTPGLNKSAEIAPTPSAAPPPRKGSAPSHGSLVSPSAPISKKKLDGIASATTDPVNPNKAGAHGGPHGTRRGVITVTLKHIVFTWAAFMALLLLMATAWERPPWWEPLLAMLFTIPMGFLYAYLHNRNRVRKMESSYLVGAAQLCFLAN